MADITVVVTFGRDRLEISGNDSMTFGDIRRKAEERAGTVDGGLRLLHKGKCFADSDILKNYGVKSGTRMMALRTKKQFDMEKDLEKKNKLSRDNSAVVDMKERLRKGEASSSNADASGGKNVILGDDHVEGATHVILIKGRSKFRVNVDFSLSVLGVKQKAGKMDGVLSNARDMKLLFKGKVLEDTKTLAEYGAKDGAALMLLFSARYHDAKEDSDEIGSIEEKVFALESKAKRLVSQMRHRVLDAVSMTIAREEAEEELSRLKDNLQSVKGYDARRPAIHNSLMEIVSMLESLE